MNIALPSWKIWVLAARPKTLSAIVAPILIGSALAYKTGSFSPLLFLFTLLAGLCLQIGTNFANDLFDFLKGADTKERIGPTRVTEAGLVSPNGMKWATFIAFGSCALCSLVLLSSGGLWVALLALVSIALGLLYTAGPYPLAYLGLGELFVLLFFGPVATGATFLLQTGRTSLSSLLLGVAIGGLSCGLILINNLRDEAEDRKAKKNTIIVRFGPLLGKRLYLFFHLFALTLGMVISPYFLVLAPFSFLLVRSLLRTNESRGYLPLLPKTALFQMAYTALTLLGILQ